MYVYQHQRATNNANGNPRRLWRVWMIEPGDGLTDRYGLTVAIVDEGYGNFPRDRFPGAVELASVNITGPEYSQTIRRAREAGTLVHAS